MKAEIELHSKVQISTGSDFVLGCSQASACGRELQRIDAAIVPHGGHRLETGEGEDVADHFGGMFFHEETHGIVDAFRFARMERDGGNRFDRLSAVVGQVSLFNRETHGFLSIWLPVILP